MEEMNELTAEEQAKLLRHQMARRRTRLAAP